MGCGGAGGARGQIDLPKPLTISGTVIDSQSRSLMTICDRAGVKFVYNQINPLKKENQGAKYLEINPTGHIPMIQHNQFKVLGGNHIIYVYLCKSNSVISAALMP